MFNSEYEIGTAICLEEGGLVCFSPMVQIPSASDTAIFGQREYLNRYSELHFLSSINE